MTASRLPRVVWLLGLVSLCMDLSSEMIHALLAGVSGVHAPREHDDAGADRRPRRGDGLDRQSVFGRAQRPARPA